MFSEVLDLFKRPVSTMVEKSQEKNIKKESIIAGIIAVIIAILTILTTYIGVMKLVNKTYKSLNAYNKKYSFAEVTKSEFKELKKEAKKSALENANLTKTFFKTLAITIVAIALIAGILFAISFAIKSPKNYLELLTITNRAFIIYALGFIINTIFSFIYGPIGAILLLASIVYALLSLANAFNLLIEVEDKDKLVLVSTIVIGIVIAVLVFIVNSYINSLFSLSNLL